MIVIYAKPGQITPTQAGKRLTKGLDTKFHLYMFSKDFAWPVEYSSSLYLSLLRGLFCAVWLICSKTMSHWFHE